MRLSTASTARAHGCSAAPEWPATRPLQTASIATGDSREKPTTTSSSRPVFLDRLLERVLGLFDVLERQFARFHQAGHQRPETSAEHSERFVDQRGVRLV